MQLSSKLHEVLEKYWGHTKFRKKQAAIIESILAGKSTLVILPTGGGKSLCYQLPALISGGMAIVISPLIALMKSQVDALQHKNIAADFLNSTLPKKKSTQVKEAIVENKLTLLYIAPETLNKEETIQLLKRTRLSFIAIDEAHCISDWGYDFRPEYRKLSETVVRLGSLPVMALTATATPQVQKDIIRNLNMQEPNSFIDSFDRPNLYYEVQSKSAVEKKLIHFIQSMQGGPGIIYCHSRKKTESLASFLQRNGIKARAYHAGLDNSLRAEAQDEFLHNHIDIIVATIAFGMGIDKPDVRFIVHYDAPRSLESYYQETGRAGRDGKPAHCILFYDRKDLLQFEKFNNKKLVSEKKKLKIFLDQVHNYATSFICRRQQILYHFGEIREGICGTCDNCQRCQGTYEGQEHVQQLLETIKATGESYDANYIADLLSGVETPAITSNEHHKLPLFGLGKKDAPIWRGLLLQMLILGYLVKEHEESESLRITPKGEDFLLRPTSFLLPRQQSYDLEERSSAYTREGKVDIHLLAKLETLCQQEAERRGIQAYLIFEKKMLEAMASYYPASTEALTMLPGIGLNKAQKFGAPFIALIISYVTEYDLRPLLRIKVRTPSTKQPEKRKQQIIQQVDAQQNLENIAASLQISFQELVRELEQICAAGVQLRLSYYTKKFFSAEEQQDLYDYFYTMEEDNIEKACSELEEEYEEEHVRLMRIQFLSEIAS